MSRVSIPTRPLPSPTAELDGPEPPGTLSVLGSAARPRTGAATSNVHPELRSNAFRAGKEHGHWLDLRVDGLREESPYVERQRQGRWLSYGFDESNSRPRLIELYRDGERIDY